MCNRACVDFVLHCLAEEDVKEKKVIEVGSLNINGSVRTIVEKFAPLSYVGVDLLNGPGVDIVCDAQSLLEYFKAEEFDLLISTEMVEHVRNWRVVIENFKGLLRPNGVLVITTRSKGFGYHGYPFDFWRYGIDDMKAIFSDFKIEAIADDPLDPGVFIKARKPINFQKNNCKNHQLYSIIRNRRIMDIDNFHILLFKLRYPIRSFLSYLIPPGIKRYIKAFLLRANKSASEI